MPLCDPITHAFPNINLPLDFVPNDPRKGPFRSFPRPERVGLSKTCLFEWYIARRTRAFKLRKPGDWGSDRGGWREGKLRAA